VKKNVALTPFHDNKLLPDQEVDQIELLLLSGENKGQRITLEKNQRYVIGRSEKADIRIIDESVSREHVEIVFKDEDYMITDLFSQNGLYINDEKIKQGVIRPEDRFVIGKIVFKVRKKEISPEDIEKKQESLAENTKGKGANKVVLIIVGLLLVLVLVDTGSNDNENDNLKNKRSGEISKIRNLTITANKIVQADKDEQETRENLESVIHRGQRELREGNFYRAMSEFSLALVMSPNHPRASFYLEKAKTGLDDQVQAALIRGERDLASLKFEEGLISFCSILRLLENSPEDKRIKIAKDKIKQIEDDLGINSENHCK